MALKSNFVNYDMYSKRTSFFYNNQEKIGSYFGLFLTFIYIVASLGLFIYQIILAFERKELNVYDATIYSQQMPSIDINSSQFYFAFGLEEPSTANRFIDDSIYIPKIAFVDKIKINDEFITKEQKTLEYERCNAENFGKNYQNLFLPNELNNSYCLKNFNNSLTFAGGYKYERMTYIRIRIYPCVNTTKNNNHCKPQEEIDYYMTSGYFSILMKDVGLNPSNFSFPVLPTLQDLYTTIDKRLYKNYILNFGITEVQTDTGIINENIKFDKYLQFRKELQTFSFRDEIDYYNGKSVILVQLKLDDKIVIQKRSYLKINVILSRIGGYMQLMNTIFLLLTSIVNRLNSQLKIINSIFNFNLKKNKVILKFHTLKESNIIINSKSNKYLRFTSKKYMDNSKQLENENRSRNNLILKENDFNNMAPAINIIKNENHNNTVRINQKINIFRNESSKAESIKGNNIIKENSLRFNNENLQKNNFDKFEIKNEEIHNIKDFNDHMNLSFFDFFNCNKKKSKQYRLFLSGNRFFKKKMDIVHVFTIITISEKFFANNYYDNNNNKNFSSLYQEIELLNL